MAVKSTGADPGTGDLGRLGVVLDHGTPRSSSGRWRRVLLLAVLGSCVAACGSSRAGNSTPGLPAPARAPLTTMVGRQPIFEAEDLKTETLYVSNSGDGTLSVVNMTTCNISRQAGCSRHWPTIAVGNSPFGIAVDDATGTVYVTNAPDGTVTLFDGATCNATRTSGCRQKPVVLRVGSFPSNLAIDPATNMIYVVNQDDSSVSVIDGNSCKAATPGGCLNQPFVTVPAGGGVSGVRINSATNTVYAANTGETNDNRPLPNGDTLSVINGATCLPTAEIACRPVATVHTGPAPADLTIDPATGTLYVTNTYDLTGQPTGTISVVDGNSCNATLTSGCSSQHPPEVPVGGDPDGQVFDPSTGKAYFANQKSNTLSVINSGRCSTAHLAGCTAYSPATIEVGSNPDAVVANLAMHTIYVVDNGDNNLTLLNEG